MEREFSAKMASSGDPVYAAEKAGYSHPHQAASKNLANPTIADDIRKRALHDLVNTILPLAIKTHEFLLTDKNVPAGAKAQAIKIAYDRTLDVNDEGRTKEPHEMTADEIERRIQKLRQEAANRAKPVLDNAAPTSVFE